MMVYRRTMRNLISLGLAVATVLSTAVDAYGLAGSWRGELELGQMKLPLVFNFSETPDGKTSCTLDSPAQGSHAGGAARCSSTYGIPDGAPPTFSTPRNSTSDCSEKINYADRLSGMP